MVFSYYSLLTTLFFGKGDYILNEEKLWSKEFIFVALINFLITLTYFLLLISIGPLAKSEYGTSTSIAGLVSSIFIIGALIGRLFSGRGISIFGAKKILIIGLIACVISSILYFFTFNLSTLLINRFFHGISVGIIGTATGSIAAMILPNSRKGEGIGYYSLSSVFSTAIGPFVGILLFKMENNSELLFGLNVVISLIALLLYPIIKNELPNYRKKIKETNEKSIISQYIEPKAFPISLLALIVGFSFSGIMSFLTFYAEEINLISAASYFFLIYAFVVLFSRPFTGKLMDLHGANVIMYPCFILFALGMLLFSQATTGLVLLISAGLIGLGYGNFFSIAQTIAVKVSPHENIGLATSTFFILFDIGLGVGPYLLGYFASAMGYRSMYFSMVFIIIICIPIYYLLHGKKESTTLT